LVAGLLAVTAVAAVAKDSKAKVKGLGKAEVKWNAVTFRPELMDMLKPGLTWRMGKDGATRLKIEGMALVGQGCFLLPGEMTLNLRYWSDDNWELVVFEENRWNWGEDVTGLGILPTDVGKIPKPGKPAKALQLELKVVTKANPSRVARPVLTGPDEDDDTFTETSPDVTYAKEARAELEALPLVELHTRFGPHMALTTFDPVKTVALAGERVGAGDAEGPDQGKKRKKKKDARKGGKQKLRIHWALHGAVRARTDWVEKHEGELTVGLFDRGAPGGEPVVLVLTGGEMPFLWRVPRKGGESYDSWEGRRVPTQKVPEQVTADLKGTRLTIHLANVDYVFEL
jgi:hypothetical protein